MRNFWLIFSIIFVTLAIFSNDCGVSAEPLTAQDIRTAANTAFESNHQYKTYLDQYHYPLIARPHELCKSYERRADVRIADEMWQYYSQNPAIKEKIRDNQINNLKTAVTGQIQSEPIRGILKTLSINDNCGDVQLSYDLAFIHFETRPKYEERGPLGKKVSEDTLAAYHDPEHNEAYHLVLSRLENQSHCLLLIECERYYAAQNDDDRRESLERMKVLLFKPFFWYEVRIYMWSFAKGPDGEIDGDAVDYYYNFAVSHLGLQYVSLLLYGVQNA